MSQPEKQMSYTDDAQEIDFDPDSLRAKYQRERERRLRADGQDQYPEVSGKLARFADADPYVATPFTRAPLTDEVEVVIIGGGWSGLISAARLREAGINDIRLIEDGADFGGTWYWNRYPGAQCDIESYCYLPLLEETGYIPKEKYSFAPEIFAHAQRIGKFFNLYEVACFQTRVTELRCGRVDQTLDRQHQSQRRDEGALRRHGVRAGQPSEAARYSWPRGFRRTLFPHQPMGLRVHRRRQQRKPGQACRQAGCDHRNRRERDTMRAPCRRSRRASLCFSANSVFG